MDNKHAIKIGQRALRVSEKSLNDFIAAHQVNPEDCFAPEEKEQPPKTSHKVARSSWMKR